MAPFRTTHVGVAPACAAIDARCPEVPVTTLLSAASAGVVGFVTTVRTTAFVVAVAVEPFSEFVTTQSYEPAFATATPFANVSVNAVAPLMAAPLKRHWYVSVPFPVAATLSVACVPATALAG
jgi:hypothetical protein